ncbi:MAG: cytochrome c family protein [Deltaproteobacteria bacterium]|nr:cytochrome c family protein [Deltaproteobacteria bacterium]
MRKNGYLGLFLGVGLFLFWGRPSGWSQAEMIKTYVGSAACSKCHEQEYKTFTAYARKAHSYRGIKLMKKGLTEAQFQACLGCHTTGYGKPGGFRSEEETPELKDAGCEVCHGPGSQHIVTKSSTDIHHRITAKDCEGCHDKDRIAAFRYKPMVHGGAH